MSEPLKSNGDGERAKRKVKVLCAEDNPIGRFVFFYLLLPFLFFTSPHLSPSLSTH
jgi:hypothetical protein